MLPKLEIHFGDAVLRIPQTKRVNLIMCAYGAHTLKENLLSCYKSRVRDVLKEQGIIRNYHDVTNEEAETRLLKDLKELGMILFLNMPGKSLTGKSNVQVVWYITGILVTRRMHLPES